MSSGNSCDEVKNGGFLLGVTENVDGEVMDMLDEYDDISGDVEIDLKDKTDIDWLLGLI